MVHDKFCLVYPAETCCTWLPEPCNCQCICDEIAAIREDERNKIINDCE